MGEPSLIKASLCFGGQGKRGKRISAALGFFFGIMKRLHGDCI